MQSGSIQAFECFRAPITGEKAEDYMTREPTTKYQRAVNWIAFNDDDAVLDELQIEEFVTVALVADLFGKPTDQVAEDVLKVRKANL